MLAEKENFAGLGRLNRTLIGRAEAMDSACRAVLDMDSTEIPVYGEQEQTAYNGHFESTCYHPLLLFNREGDCLAAKLRPGNVHSAEDWEELLLPEIERQQKLGKEVVFRADAAFAKPEIYEALEERGVKYAIRIPSNDSLERDIEELLTRPVGRPSHKPVVWYKSFLYQAASWKTARRVVAKVEFHFGELFPRVGFIVTNLETDSRAVVRFYNKRGTAEQWIKEGKQAVKMTRLSCHRFRSNEVRLWLSVIAYNLGNLWRRLVLPKRIGQLVAHQLTAEAGEDGRSAGETCPLLLATAGREPSDAAAVSEPCWAGSPRCPCQPGRRADDRIGFPRGERQGAARCRKHGSREGRLRPLGFSREARMAPSVARESTLHCKLDSQLHWAAVRSTFWVGGKWIMEIPD